MNTWLVMVNATKYNLFGAVRKYGKGIPWFFDGVKGEPQVGDKVLFYLTSSKPSKYDEGYGMDIIGSLYKRVVFEGVITEVGAALKKADIDSEYWNKSQAERYRDKCKDLVIIKIVKPLYDDQDMRNKGIDFNKLELSEETYVAKMSDM